MIVEPEQVYIEFLISALTESDIINWACEALAGPLSENDLVCEIAGLNTSIRSEYERASILLTELIKQRGFIANSAEGVAYAKNALRVTCERYLRNEIRPYDLCRMVSPIEQIFDFPKWLGNLYNVCDWIEPETNHKEVPYLEKEVTLVFQALNRSQKAEPAGRGERE